jgi:type IV pilus assembly protein PilA
MMFNYQGCKKTKGFSLVELMIVVAIIGILAAIAVPAYSDYMVKIRIAKTLKASETLKQLYADKVTDFGGASIAGVVAGMPAWSTAVATNPEFEVNNALNNFVLTTCGAGSTVAAANTGVITYTFGANGACNPTGTATILNVVGARESVVVGAVPTQLFNTPLTQGTSGTGVVFACAGSAARAVALTKVGALAPIGSVPEKYLPAECR